MQAVLWAAFFNFLAYAIFELKNCGFHCKSC